jgi:TPR repeat protein
MYALGELHLRGDEVIERDVTAAQRYLQQAHDVAHYKAPWLLSELYYKHTDVPGGVNCTKALEYMWVFTSERSDWSEISTDALEALTGEIQMAQGVHHGAAPLELSAHTALLNYVFLAEQGSVVAGMNAGWMLERGQGLPRSRLRSHTPSASSGVAAGAGLGKVPAIRDTGSNSEAWLEGAQKAQQAHETVEHPKRAPTSDSLQLAAYYYGRVARTGFGPALVDYGNLLMGVQHFRHDLGRGIPQFRTIDGYMSLRSQELEAIRLYFLAKVGGDAEATTNLAWTFLAGVGTDQNMTRALALYATAVDMAPFEADKFAPRVALTTMRVVQALQLVLPEALGTAVKKWVCAKAREGMGGVALPTGAATILRRVYDRTDAILRLAAAAMDVVLHAALGPPGVVAAGVVQCREDPVRLDGAWMCP